MDEQIKEKTFSTTYGTIGYSYEPLKKKKTPSLNEKEKEIIDRVITTHANKSTSQLIEYVYSLDIVKNANH